MGAPLSDHKRIIPMMTTATQNTTHRSASGKRDLRQLVVFQLGGEGYCVDISKVREINRVVEITHIPQSPPFVEGVINLRGQIIPIIDLRRRFDLTDNIAKESNETRIMVVDTNGTLVGFIVDAVKEVLRISADQIEPTPDLVTSDIDRKYIEGVATVEDRLLIILNSDLIFATEELGDLQAVKEAHASD